MNKQIVKNILYIKNFKEGKNQNHLLTIPNIKVKFMNSTELIGYTIEELKNIIEPYNYIILGGGKQHLTFDDFLTKYPEIKNQIEIVKLISNHYIKDKLLIGICLGCQIIALGFGLKIIPMKKLFIGFDYLDLDSINQEYISKSNDKYLNKLDFELLSKSFSFHWDCVDFSTKSTNKLFTNNDELVLIAESIEKHPYVIANTNSNIYGFQSHPEISLEAIFCAINTFGYTDTIKMDCIKNNLKLNELENIYKHFFNIFLDI